MTPQTLRTLAVLSAIILVVGAMVPAPMGRLFAAGLGGLLALLPLGWGTPGLRLAGLLVLLAAGAMAVEAYPEAGGEYRQYVEHRR